MSAEEPRACAKCGRPIPGGSYPNPVGWLVVEYPWSRSHEGGTLQGRKAYCPPCAPAIVARIEATS